MDKQTMKKRLEAGYDPIDVSIEKWKDLEKKWDNNSAGNKDKSCALCETCFVCDDCPLTKIDDYCLKMNSSWRKAKYHKNPQIMLKALYKAKEWAETQKTYSIGDRLIIDEDEYIIGRCGINRIVLIRLDNGNYWTTPTDVKDDLNITEQEIQSIFENTNCTSWRKK